MATNVTPFLTDNYSCSSDVITDDLLCSFVFRYHFYDLGALRCSSSLYVNLPTDPPLTLKLTQLCAHPLPQRCTGTALKLSKQPASHTPCVHRVLASNTLACNTHPMNNGVHASPCADTSRSELQWVFQTAVLQHRETDNNIKD